MILTKEKGRRMWGGETTIGDGGGSSSQSLAGYASMMWVENNYLSKEFFNQLFKVKATVTSTINGQTVTQDIDLLPNDLVDGYTVNLKNVKVEAGLWTEQFLSALGLNQGGGGGGVTLNEPLSSINSSGLAVPGSSQDGMTVVWDNTQQKWKYGSAGGGGGSTAWADITGKPTTITGYGITDAKIVSGTITLGADSITPLTSSDISDMATMTWVGQQGFALASNVYSKTDADQKFMTIAAFENLFNALASDGTTKVSHPYASGVSSIKAMVGLWTEQYLSALGQNGGGGGVTLNEPLASINTAGLGAPSQSGVAIMWNGSAWTYQVPGGGGGGGGTVTSVGLSMPTGFNVASSPVTGSGTIVVSFASGYLLPTISKQTNWDTAYEDRHSHSNKSVLDGITSTDVSNWGSAYSKATTIEEYFDSNGNAKSALKLTTVSKTAWGQTYWTANGVPDNVDGNISAGNSGGVIEKFHAIELNNAGSLSSYGGFVDFHYNGSAADYTTRMIEEAAGVVSIYGKNSASPYADKLVGVNVGSNVTGGSYLQIGTVRLVYDHENTALKVEKQDGTAANLYATGGVSALGMMANESGTLTNLNLSGTLGFPDNYQIKVNEGDMYIGDSDNQQFIKVSDICSWTGDSNWNIQTNGYARFKRVYLGSTRYLYLDTNNVLKYYDNGTVRTIAFA